MFRHKADGKTARPAHGSRWAVGLLAACALSAGVVRLAAATDGSPANPASDVRAKAGTDLYGDPLPSGALARLGTVRWRHTAPVTYVAFTADGKAVLTASQDNTIRLWDLRTGKELRRFGERPAALPKPGGDAALELRLQQAVLARRLGRGGPSVAFAPRAGILAAVSPPNSVGLWDVATGRKLRTLNRPSLDMDEVLLSADGKLLAGRGRDQTIHLWDATTGKELRQLGGKENARPGGTVIRLFGGGAGLALSPNGKLVAAPEMTFDNQRVAASVIVWDATTGKALHRIEEGARRGQSALAFSPDSKLLAHSSGSTIRLTAADTGKEVRQIAGPQIGVTALAFSPDGKLLAATGARDGLVKLYAVETGQVLRPLGKRTVGGLGNGGFLARGGAGQALAFSPDGKRVATGGGLAVRIWDADTGKEVAQLTGHRAAVAALAVAPDGKLVASQGADNTVRLWEAATGKQRHQFDAPAGTTCVAFAPDARSVALGNVDSSVRLHEMATGKELHRLAGHRGSVAAVAFSPDGKALASRGGADMTIRVHEAATGKELRVIPLVMGDAAPAPGQRLVINVGGFGSSRLGLAFSPDGKTIATPGVTASMRGWGGAGALGTLELWDVATGKRVHKIALLAQYGVVSFAFAPDGRTLATENTDRTITLWEIASGKERARFGNTAAVVQPAGTPVMFGGGLRGYGQASASLTVAFLPDGRALAARGPDRSVCVWDVASGKEMARLKGHDGAVAVVAVAADGKTLASGSGDTTVLIWDATRWRAAPRPRSGQLRAEEVEGLWTDLAGVDAARAYRAIQALGTAPAQAVPFLRERLRPTPPVEGGKIRGLVADLNARQFSVRQGAMSALEKLGGLAVPALNEALKASPPLETRKRVEQLLEKLTGRALSGEQLRLVRALEVLEDVGTPAARGVLEALAAGAPGALPTQEARAALDRLAARRGG